MKDVRCARLSMVHRRISKYWELTEQSIKNDAKGQNEIVR